MSAMLNEGSGGASSLTATYAAMGTRRVAVLAIGCVAILVSLVLDVATGPAFLPVGAVAKSVFGLAQDRTVDAIVWSIRSPRPAILRSLAVPASSSRPKPPISPTS